jgi:hypothetical protein
MKDLSQYKTKSRKRGAIPISPALGEMLEKEFGSIM